MSSAGEQPLDVFRHRLKEVRELRGWNQGDLAREAHLPPTTVAHFESGSRKPSFDNLRKLANALNVSTDYLLGRTDDPVQVVGADPLYRHMDKLTGEDREIAREFVEMLAKRSEQKRKG